MCKHIPHSPSIRALTASSCHGKFRAQCLGMPGATATLSREQEPSFCWLGMGRSLEPHLLNFLTSAQRPTLQVPRHSAHTPSLGATFTCTRATGDTCQDSRSRPSDPAVFCLEFSWAHPHVHKMPKYETADRKTLEIPSMCAYMHVFACINVQMHIYYRCVS